MSDYRELLAFDYELLHRELVAAGCTVTLMITDGVPRLEVADESQQSLRDLVAAAHGKAMDGAEVAALRKKLGAESAEWTAYAAVRKAPIDRLRKERYREQTDHILLDLLADGVLTALAGGENVITVDPKRFVRWLDARKRIREDIPK
jgi:hypothetical protein